MRVYLVYWGSGIEDFVIDFLYFTFIDSEFIETDSASGRKLTLSRTTKILMFSVWLLIFF